MVIAFLRTIILYLFIIVGIRLMGKRQVGELEPSELVLALLIADLAAVPMQDFGIPLLTGIIPILTLLCLTMALSVLTMKSVRFRAVLCGRPSIIVENGKLHQREMQKNRFTVDELMEELPEVDGVMGTGSYTEIVPALEELMDRDMGFACGLAGSVLRGRPRDAEEVVSDAFLALWEHAGQVEPGKLRPWLGRVVRNKALNRLRALGGELPLEEDWLALEPDRRPGPAEAVEQAERAELIRALLNGLPPQDRAIFLRHYYYGQTAADIGAALAMPPSTVKVRLHRGRKKLKELLMERGYSCACADD